MYARIGFIFIITIKICFAENLGSCFGDDEDTACEKNRLNFYGDFYECKVLTRFKSIPTRLIYDGENVYFKIDGEKFMYNLETNETIRKDFNVPSLVKTITYGNVTFAAGTGKAIVKLPDEDDDLTIYTSATRSFDQIDLYNNSLFILSRYKSENKKDDVGDLYVVDASDLARSDDLILSNPMNTLKQKFSSLVVVPEKDILLLSAKDSLGGKLISISLKNFDPCEDVKRSGNIGQNLSTLPNDEKSSFIQIVNEAEMKLSTILKNFASAIGLKDGDSSNRLRVLENENKQLKIQYEKLHSRVYKNKYNRPSISSGGSFGGPPFAYPQSHSSGGSSGGGYIGGGIGNGGIISRGPPFEYPQSHSSGGPPFAYPQSQSSGGSSSGGYIGGGFGNGGIISGGQQYDDYPGNSYPRYGSGNIQKNINFGRYPPQGSQTSNSNSFNDGNREYHFMQYNSMGELLNELSNLKNDFNDLRTYLRECHDEKDSFESDIKRLLGEPRTSR